MPVQHCQRDGKPGFRWGGKGHCYTYTASSKGSKLRARMKARAQGRAAYAAGYKGK